MNVFGIGVSRTGGRSLTYALKELGYDAKHWPLSAVKQDLSLDMQRVARWDAIIDLPASLNYQALDKEFPDAKFVLTIRSNTDAWLESMYRLHNHQRPFVAWMPRVLALDQRFWGTLRYNPNNLLARYEQHTNEVRNYFATRPEKLLELDVAGGEGYEKLCPFLDKPVLNKPFPHKNRNYHRWLTELFH